MSRPGPFLLPSVPISTLAAHLDAGGGVGIERTQQIGPTTRLLDLAGGRAVYDETFWRKRPDWTFVPA